MTIVAKYASVCPDCGKTISPGQQVEWERGRKARHTNCGAVGQAPSAASTSRTITLTRDGRRTYIGGDTMAVRGVLKDGGCHWDADRKAWWIGDHATAETLAELARTAPAEQAPKRRITNCVGCGGALDRFAQQRGFRFCSKDCANDVKLGGQSGYINGSWHQGSDD